ncbi:hypothetical protein TNCV_1563321 [Trichonephila clavipes]|nr:hypothetical protein TNCV_1563321 [Trichonephila clavipes]
MLDNEIPINILDFNIHKKIKPGSFSNLSRRSFTGLVDLAKLLDLTLLDDFIKSVDLENFVDLPVTISFVSITLFEGPCSRLLKVLIGKNTDLQTASYDLVPITMEKVSKRHSLPHIRHTLKS